VPASFSSETVSFEGIYCTPAPAQDRLPVWYGAALSHRMVDRIVELGDGWYPIGVPSASELAPQIARLRDAFAAAGRDPATLGVRRALALVRDESRNLDLPATMAPIGELAGAGVTVFGITLRPGVETMSDVGTYLEGAVAAFHAAF
jgi:alkanesulfonate monooxygenase SsuD/methylene tetrahydromethanopterin reductase-like flavin-dependent oxidoreductase (luciferase family)